MLMQVGFRIAGKEDASPPKTTFEKRSPYYALHPAQSQIAATKQTILLGRRNITTGEL